MATLRGGKISEWSTVKEGSQMQLAGWCAVQYEWCTCHSQNCFHFFTACNRAGFCACVLARSGRSGSLGLALRDFCVRGDARPLVKQLDQGRQPQHAVASVLARGGWHAAAAATADVDRSYLVLAINTLQVSRTMHLANDSSSTSPSLCPSERSI